MKTAKPKQYKPKKCKVCKGSFIPARPLQQVCSAQCGYKYANKTTEKNLRRTNKAKLRDMMTKGEHLKELQVVFNRFIRTRDKDLPCISCGTRKPVRYDAGHFYSVGAYPNLRFNEDNVHKQCSKNCNKERHGNTHEYAARLKKRIGEERYSALGSQRATPLRLTIPEIIELKQVYRNTIKELTR
jgi:hypothetical protein